MNRAKSAAYCRGVMQHHARSFYFATRLLPSAKRDAIEALYAFFRSVDDAADEGNAGMETRRARMRAFRTAVESLHGGPDACEEPWFDALSRAYIRYAIDRRPLLELIDGCESDLGTVDIASMNDLENYARAVAGTVGRSVVPILGATGSDALALGERLGVAMQLTNVLRDVADDERQGRNYLPLREFPGAGGTDAMRAVAAQARRQYDAGRALVRSVPNDGSRAALLMAAAFYEGILGRIERRGFDRAGRAFVGGAAKWGLAAKCVFSAYTGLAIIK
jgi:phytoene/squalene synthetase